MNSRVWHAQTGPCYEVFFPTDPDAQAYEIGHWMITHNFFSVLWHAEGDFLRVEIKPAQANQKEKQP